MKSLAKLYNSKGNKCLDAGDNPGAIEAFQKALQHAPKWPTPWYNLGLTYKYMGEWQESCRCNAEAVRLEPANEAAIWNLGIAATALRNWPEARRAWSLFGFPVSAGDSPPELDLGLGPIRINPDGGAEVIWAHRIDPARAILMNIPLPESNHRHGDLVLDDGAAVGYRRVDGRDLPVLNELALLVPSHKETFEVTITVNTMEELVEFEEACQVAGCATDDWSAMQMLCKACSEGHPHDHPEPEIQGEHRFAVAAGSLQAVQSAVSNWLAATPRVSAGPIVEHLAPLPRQ